MELVRGRRRQGPSEEGPGQDAALCGGAGWRCVLSSRVNRDPRRQWVTEGQASGPRRQWVTEGRASTAVCCRSCGAKREEGLQAEQTTLSKARCDAGCTPPSREGWLC